MLAFRTIAGVLVTALLIVGGPMGPSAFAAPTNAVCNVDITVTLKPGLSSTPSEGTLNSHGKGILDCEGTVDGHVITGPGTITARGFYRGDCATSAADGVLTLSFPTTTGTVSAEARFVAQALLSAGPFLVSSKKVGDAEGVFVPVDAEGDCVSEPVTQVRARVIGLVFKKA